MRITTNLHINPSDVVKHDVLESSTTGRLFATIDIKTPPGTADHLETSIYANPTELLRLATAATAAALELSEREDLASQHDYRKALRLLTTELDSIRRATGLSINSYAVQRSPQVTSQPGDFTWKPSS